MEIDICDTNHLDADVRLPPRKRLLAGLKKRKSADNSNLQSLPTTSKEFNSPPPSSKPLASHFNGPDLSLEEVAEASKTAAEDAIKAAEAARSVAEEKATIAVRAITAAKSALDLVASFDELAVLEENQLKKNKLKKQLPVQLLYKKLPMEICKNDEELALKLHRDMNRSSRISKNCSGSNSKSHKHKRSKTIYANGHAVSPDGLTMEPNTFEVDRKTSKSRKQDQNKMDSGDDPLEKTCVALDEGCGSDKKRSRVKLKKLCLTTSDSMNNIQASPNPKERISTSTQENSNDEPEPIGDNNESLLSMETSGAEASHGWECQDVKVPECVN